MFSAELSPLCRSCKLSAYSLQALHIEPPTASAICQVHLDRAAAATLINGLLRLNMQDSLAEWSKALASGASPKGRGFEPHSCHLVKVSTMRRDIGNALIAVHTILPQLLAAEGTSCHRPCYRNEHLAIVGGIH